jgi:formate dehydrogenase subunit beta
MQELRAKARQLLESGTVKVVIGHGPGSAGRRRPLFARTAAEAETLVHDDECWHNLAGYLTRPEVRLLGRAAVVARPAVLRSILQLAAERQLREEDLLALAVADGSVRELPTFAAIEEHVATLPDALHSFTQQALERLAAMSPAERREYWAAELSRCLKCYACREACPMCYCERCTMDCNRPQWVPAASHALGNLEYHLVRAMHLAGRCVQCAACFSACPVGIPVHLLSTAAEQSVRRQFGGSEAYALSSFRPDDKETFIR